MLEKGNNHSHSILKHQSNFNSMLIYHLHSWASVRQNLSKSACSASLLYFTPSLDFSVQISSTSPIVTRSRSRIEIPTSQHRRRNSGVVISRSLLPVLFLPARPSSGCRPTAPGSAGAPGRSRTSRTDPATHRWSWGWKDPREKP